MDDLALSFNEQATCRICRAEATPEEPLFHPCKCSGSIRNVHQECLVEWLSHSQKKHCELCKTPFRFTKLYDAHMPEKLPWRVFMQRAIWDTWSTIFGIARTSFVACVWLIVLPCLIRWAWQSMFWFADAGWARDDYLRRQHYRSMNITSGTNSSLFPIDPFTTWGNNILGDLLGTEYTGNGSALQFAFDFLGSVLEVTGITAFTNTTHFDIPKPAETSVFSSLSYLNSLTPYAPLNRIILDIFEGQLITCTVILSFILIFLIREWVVQQQPLVNLEPVIHQHDGPDRAEAPQAQALQQAQPGAAVDDRYRVLAERLADLRDNIEADLEGMENLQDRVQAQIQQARRPGMPNRDASAHAAHIRRALEESNARLKLVESSFSDAVPGDSSSSRPSGEQMLRSTDHVPEPRNMVDPHPITNAGVDARLNVRWRKGTAPIVIPPPADNDASLLTSEGLAELLEDDAAMPLGELTAQIDQLAAQPRTSDELQSAEEIAQNETASPSSEAMSPSTDAQPQEVIGGESPASNQAMDDEAVPEVVDDPPRLPLKRTLFNKFADWFWDGIEANTNAIDDQVFVIDEQRLGLGGNEAPFVPVNHVHGHDQGDVDPEVAAAAQQAGIDPDLGDGAEEMEGLLELIGLRGPLVGMIQTSLFCLLLVASTVLAAVVVPYVWGKMVLSFVGSPVYFLVILPLRAMSFSADLIVDATLFLGGWLLTVSAVATEAVLASISTIWPRLSTIGSVVTRISNAALTEASASGDRLRSMFTGQTAGDPFNFNEGILGASAHAHSSLNSLVSEVNAIMNFTSNVLHQGAHAAAIGDFGTMRSGLHALLAHLPRTPHKMHATVVASISAVSDVLSELKHGNIALPMPKKALAFDSALIYWNPFDRTLAVAAGYLALAALAAVYVASNTFITSSVSGRKIETMVRDSLRQAGGVLKVILIISIEMLVFPTYCGLLLDFAFLPLFGGSALNGRLAFAASRPYIFCFVHWFLGTYYMFHFALFVGMCRKILRKGVLWFIRDPDDPTFHPVRDVLERNVMTQLRKIAFSALVYGALVILCLGGVIWSIGKLFNGIFPIVWRDTEPILEFPMDLFLYNFLIPLVIAYVRPSEGLQAAYSWWLRRCARLLRLSHFLFGQRMKDEEGYYVFPTWSSMIHMPSFDLQDGSVKSATTQENAEADPLHIKFCPDGTYVFTPCHDQYRPPKRGEMFFSHTSDDDVDIVGQDGKHHPHWSKVYLPPYFKFRVMLFMVCLWIFSAFAGLCITLVPLAFGRRVLTAALPGTTVNDIYAYSIGAYVLGGLAYLILRSRAAVLASRVAAADGLNDAVESWRASVVGLAKCFYVYGYIFVVQPLVTAGVLEVYFLMPVHTVLALNSSTPADIQGGDLALNNTSSVSQQSSSWTSFLVGVAGDDYSIVKHDVHLAQDFALAVLIVRLVAHFIAAKPRTRAAEALRRATNDGIWKPDAWLVTRYLALPTVVVASISLLLPILGSNIALTLLQRTGVSISPTFTTLMYRFSFPMFEALIFFLLILVALSGATTRWRARIRDEVYLVGERLHNFGEKRPPMGTKSIMRRERGPA